MKLNHEGLHRSYPGFDHGEERGSLMFTFTGEEFALATIQIVQSELVLVFDIVWSKHVEKQAIKMKHSGKIFVYGLGLAPFFSQSSFSFAFR